MWHPARSQPNPAPPTSPLVVRSSTTLATTSNDANTTNQSGRQQLLPSAPAEHYQVRHLDRLDLPEALLKARRTDTINRGVAAPLEVTSRYEPDLDGEIPDGPLPESWTERYKQGPAQLAPPAPAPTRP